jgi:molecular chaperone GrpE (heat shock protein)
MRERTVVRLPKWPFVLADVILLGVALFMMLAGERPLSAMAMGMITFCVGLGGWFCILPFLREYAAEVRGAETDTLAGTLEQIRKLESVASQISGATAHWQNAQEQSSRTVGAAKEIAERIVKEANSFAEFLRKANDTEKANLRLEADKARRAEGEWLQIVTRLLDHVYALTQAAGRSGQRGLIEQLGQFQNACRDVVRRVGLTPYVPKADEAFDERTHQLLNSGDTVPAGAVISDIVATGFTYQGQLLRRAVVRVRVGGEDGAGEVGQETGDPQLETVAPQSF